MSELPRDYALLEDEFAAAGIRRIAGGRAADALVQLSGAEGEGIATGVHEARKSLKKLRSVLRLVRADLGEELYRRENDRFRDAGLALSELRDAEAMIETIEALRKRFDRELGPTALDPLAEALGAERDGGGEAQKGGERRPPEVERAIGMIDAGRREIAGWPLGRDDFELVRPGLQHAYARGRRRMAAVLDDPAAEAVHEWRKRVKDLWYMSSVLERVWPEVVGAVSKQAHELSSLLGDHHDLAVLAERVQADHGLLGAALPPATMADLLERRQAELLERTLPLGRRLYAEKPSRFAERIGAYWEAVQPTAGRPRGSSSS